MAEQRKSQVNLATKITIGRILVIPIFIGSAIYYNPSVPFLKFLPLIIFCLGMLSDAVDGFVARHFNQKTLLGTILDPIADKLLINAALICLAVSDGLPHNLRVPAWFPIVVISRDLIIVLGSVLIHLLKGGIKVVPRPLGKITTSLQMFAITSILIGFNFSFMLWILAGIFTVLSGIDYIYQGSRALSEDNE